MTIWNKIVQDLIKTKDWRNTKLAIRLINDPLTLWYWASLYPLHCNEMKLPHLSGFISTWIFKECGVWEETLYAPCIYQDKLGYMRNAYRQSKKKP